jgi:hypothetical protein
MRKLRALKLKRAANKKAWLSENTLKLGNQREWTEGCPKQLYRQKKKEWTRGE